MKIFFLASAFSNAFSVLWFAATLYMMYLVFQKMGLVAWKGFVPGYNLYTLCEEFDGNGWRVFLFLIPVYGLILWIKMCMRWEDLSGKRTASALVLRFCRRSFSQSSALMRRPAM